MAEPEIDEAAAWAYASNHVATMERYYPIQHRTLGMQDTYKLARAALRWKARAEALDLLVRGLRSEIGMHSEEKFALKSRAEAAEERIEALKRELKGVYKRK